MLLRAPFLCLLHINFWVLTNLFPIMKEKCDHLHNVCADGIAPTWWRWSWRAFLCLLRIKFWMLILFLNLLDKAAIISYNTTPAERGSTILYCAWPHSYHLFSDGWPHVVVGMFLLYSLYISYLPAEWFSSASVTPKSWPHINHSVLGFDHIFDHNQNRITRRQDVTRV